MNVYFIWYYTTLNLGVKINPVKILFLSHCHEYEVPVPEHKNLSDVYLAEVYT